MSRGGGWALSHPEAWEGPAKAPQLSLPMPAGGAPWCRKWKVRRWGDKGRQAPQFPSTPPSFQEERACLHRLTVDGSIFCQTLLTLFRLAIRNPGKDLAGAWIQSLASKPVLWGIPFLPLQVTPVPVVFQPPLLLSTFVSAFLPAGPTHSIPSRILGHCVCLPSDTFTCAALVFLAFKTHFIEDILEHTMETKIKESPYSILSLINQLFSFSPVPFAAQGHRHTQFSIFALSQQYSLHF